MLYAVICIHIREVHINNGKKWVASVTMFKQASNLLFLVTCVIKRAAVFLTRCRSDRFWYQIISPVVVVFIVTNTITPARIKNYFHCQSYATHESITNYEKTWSIRADLYHDFTHENLIELTVKRRDCWWKLYYFVFKTSTFNSKITFDYLNKMHFI